MGPLPKLILTAALGLTSTAGASRLQNVVTSDGPSVRWSTSDGSTVSGRHTVVAVATPSTSGTATISRVCLTQDGAPVSPFSDANTKGYTWAGFVNLPSNFGNGCWTIGSGSSGTTANFSFDSTTWDNGSRTYSVTVTDSAGRSATSNTITINHSNPQPAVSIRRFELRASGLHQLEVGASLPQIESQWSSLCIVGPTAGLSASPIGWTAATNGCWSPSTNDRRAAVVTLTVDTLSSNASIHSLNVEMRDNIGRRGNVRYEFSWTKPAVAVEILGIVPDSKITGTLNLSIQALLAPELISRVKIADFCLTVRGQTCAISSIVGPHNVQYVFDSSQYPDGNHILKATIKDSLGRTASRSYPIIIANGAPLIGALQFVEPKKQGTNARVEAVFGLSRATSGTIRYREATGKQSTVLPLQLAGNGSPEFRIAISGLTAGKTYIFEVAAQNANGRSVSKQVRYRVKQG